MVCTDAHCPSAVIHRQRNRVRALARVTGKTGVEMEALTAASVTCLTIYDMAKAVDRGMEISGIRVLAKSGGKSGDWTANPTD